MTVAELIAKLQTMPQDMMVVVPGYEAGFDNPEVIFSNLVPDANWDGSGKNQWWSGRHDNYYPNETELDASYNQPVACVVVSRGK